MPKILMKQSKPGSIDGMTTNLYKAGCEYEIDGNEINQSLATTFINEHWATMVRERVMPAPAETAYHEMAPEIKAPVEEVEEEVEEEKEIVVPEAKIVRVYELAKEMKKPWQEIVKLADKLGLDASKAQSGLTESDIKAIKKAI